MIRFLPAFALLLATSQAAPELFRSAKSGAWSDPATWEKGAVPPAGSRVQVRAGHAVLYDLDSDKAIRSIHVGGKLVFARDRDTRLDVGLIKIQPGDDPSEDGFACEAVVKEVDPAARPALEVGLPGQPIPHGRTARIRLLGIEGMDPKSCPGIVCCSGRMDFHGAPIGRTWLKLAASAKKGDAEITVEEPVGWRAGDKLIVTATQRDDNDGGTRRPGKRNRDVFTEERTLAKADGTRLTLDKPLDHDHRGEGDFRGEVANLSRNVVIESADPSVARGHTMYHRHSAGSISYAEFRGLGKEGVLGRYSLHFHLAGDTMRGSSVVGASIWNSGNRWITIHGTNYLLVKDCVGYQSVGHGYFLEDGTEVYNVLDRNLAVQSYRAKRLPGQVLPFDANDGAGFWWANSLNTFTRNVACENDEYGWRFEVQKTSQFDPTLSVRQPDGTRKPIDIRTLPFVRFDDNEAHSDGFYGFRMGECEKDRVGPDDAHPFVIRGMKIWDIHYAFRPEVPGVLTEDMKIWRAIYGVYHPDFDRHVYRRMYIGESNAEPFNRGHDDLNKQHGPLAVDGLTIEKSSGTLIQFSQFSPGGKAVAHFRNVSFKDNRRTVEGWVNTTLNGQPKNPPPDDAVAYFFHDWFGPGRHAKVITANSVERAGDGLEYRSEPPFTGSRVRVAEVKDVAFPELLKPVDDLPPATIVTSVERLSDGRLRVRGFTSDGGTLKRIVVNGTPAALAEPVAGDWMAEVADAPRIAAHAEDAAGNVEKAPHEVAAPR